MTKAAGHTPLLLFRSLCDLGQMSQYLWGAVPCKRRSEEMISQVPFQPHHFITDPTMQVSADLSLSSSLFQSHMWSEIFPFLQ